MLKTVALACGITFLAGCSGKDAAKNAGTADSAPGSTGGMQGMQMTMQGVQMMPAMRSHLDSITAMTPAEMRVAMSAHEDLASRSMDAMGADMRGMAMQPDSAWTALGDSLRRDLAELPALSGDALKTRMNAHAQRLTRMMTMHEGMMKM